MFPYTSLRFIINAKARKSAEVVKDIHQAMLDRSIDYQILKTEGPHFFKGVKHLVEKFDPYEDPLVVVVGGDGTLNYFVKQMEEEGIHQAIAYLPAGTGNDFARSMGLSFDIAEGIDRLFSIEKERPLDVIKLIDHINNERDYALNSLGFGIDGLTNYYIDQPFSKLKSAWAHWLIFPWLLWLIASKKNLLSKSVWTNKNDLTSTMLNYVLF